LRFMQYIFQLFLKTLNFLDSRKPPIPPPLTPLAGINVILGQNLKKIDICHFFKGKKLIQHAILSYFSATFQLFFPHSLRIFLETVKCCFGFLFEKLSKLRGVENAHTWRHMVRLTQRSTMSRSKCGFLKDLKC